MDIAADTLTPLNAWVSVYDGVAQGWGAYVRNTMQGLTTAQFINRTALPALFSLDVAEDMIDIYLDTMQGPWMADVHAAKPYIWSTLESPLQTGVWYAASAVWMSGHVPSGQLLEQRLKASGYNLYSNEASVIPFYYKGQPKGLTFLVFTGTRPSRVKDVMKAIGASTLLVNLAAPLDEPSISASDKVSEIGDEVMSSLTDLGVGVGEATKEVAGGTGTVVDVMGFVGKYFVPLALAGGAAYLFYKYRKKKKYNPYADEMEAYWS
jgi:hypothetical protein